MMKKLIRLLETLFGTLDAHELMAPRTEPLRAKELRDEDSPSYLVS